MDELSLKRTFLERRKSRGNSSRRSKPFILLCYLNIHVSTGIYWVIDPSFVSKFIIQFQFKDNQEIFIKKYFFIKVKQKNFIRKSFNTSTQILEIISAKVWSVSMHIEEKFIVKIFDQTRFVIKRQLLPSSFHRVVFIFMRSTASVDV